MMTLQQFAARPETVPTVTAWYLSDLGEARGKQDLFTRQHPQRLRALREHAMVESAVSSNRIEGVEVDRSRVATLVFGHPTPRDRNEEEVRGYRDALNLVHQRAGDLPVSEATILDLHRLTRGAIWDAGQYREKPIDIIQRYPDGRERVRFRPVEPGQIAGSMGTLVDLWQLSQREQWVPSLLALAAFNLDFLCIHPFRDGNGRVSRLLLLLQCTHLGYEVGRYISIERLIERNRDRYYETLEQSSHRWHEGQHDPWPYTNFLLYVLKTAYQELEERVGQTGAPRGAKTELVTAAVARQQGEFRIADIQRECPSVSVDLIRHVLKDLRDSNQVECLGRGRSARWRKIGQWELGNTQLNG
jgi:Fic family protein